MTQAVREAPVAAPRRRVNVARWRRSPRSR